MDDAEPAKRSTGMRASLALLWTKEGSYLQEEITIRSNIKACRNGMRSLAAA